MEPEDDLETRIGAIAALDQPLRRDVYRLLAGLNRWVTRDETADTLGVPRSVAAFHLDKLADAGLVDVMFERTSGRTGPGAGRPSKLYRRGSSEVAVSMPERRYDLAGSLLAAAVVEAERTGKPVAKCLAASARAAGRVIGAEVLDASGPMRKREDRRNAVMDVLTRHGYEPVLGKRGEIALVNCPFHRLAEEHRSLVCGMNLDFLAGLLDGMGPADYVSARLEPEPGYCCVRIKTA